MSKNNIELSILPLPDDENLIDNKYDGKFIVDNDTNLDTVTGSIPKISFLICFVEFSERFSYYMISGCLTNMIQRSLPKDSTNGSIVHNVSTSTETPGALGLGLPLATFTMQFLVFFANISPIISGYYSDTKIGKFKAIWTGSIIGIIGHLTLVIASIPYIMKFPHFSFFIVLISTAIISISAGFIKPNILPLLLDQYQYNKERPDYKILPDGTNVKIDHKATLEKLSMSFYMFINWGCTLSLLGSIMERYMGFWPVYLLTVIVFSFLPLLLRYLEPRIIHADQSVEIDSNITNSNVYKDFYYSLKNYFFNTPIPITCNLAIDESDIINFLNCVILFICFIPFHLNDSALISIQISLAATMSNNMHLPNDLFQAFNPIAIIILLPILSHIIYPYLLKKNKFPSSRSKILLGFIITSIGTFLGAYVQNEVYRNSTCDINNVSNCEEPSKVSSFVWICYILMFSLQAIGECFAVTTCYELAYELSPSFLRGGIIALFLTSIALSSVLGEILSIWTKDPYLVNIFLMVGTIGLISTVIFGIWSKGKVGF